MPAPFQIGPVPGSSRTRSAQVRIVFAQSQRPGGTRKPSRKHARKGRLSGVHQG